MQSWARQGQTWQKGIFGGERHPAWLPDQPRVSAQGCERLKHNRRGANADSAGSRCPLLKAPCAAARLKRLQQGQSLIHAVWDESGQTQQGAVL